MYMPNLDMCAHKPMSAHTRTCTHTPKRKQKYFTCTVRRKRILVCDKKQESQVWAAMAAIQQADPSFYDLGTEDVNLKTSMIHSVAVGHLEWHLGMSP